VESPGLHGVVGGVELEGTLGLQRRPQPHPSSQGTGKPSRHSQTRFARASASTQPQSPRVKARNAGADGCPSVPNPIRTMEAGNAWSCSLVGLSLPSTLPAGRSPGCGNQWQRPLPALPGPRQGARPGGLADHRRYETAGSSGRLSVSRPCRSSLPRVIPLPVRIERCPATPMRCVRDMRVTLGQVIHVAPPTRSRPPGQALASGNDRFATLWSNSPLPTLSCRGARP
jgi:hypothetical protein